MIARELRIGIVILSPGILRILRDGRYPNRVDTQAVEEPLLNFFRDAFQVATHIIDTRIDIRALQRSIVGKIAIVKTVNQQTIQHL